MCIVDKSRLAGDFFYVFEVKTLKMLQRISKMTAFCFKKFGFLCQMAL